MSTREQLQHSRTTGTAGQAPGILDDVINETEVQQVSDISAMAALNKSEIEAQLDAAHKYPRSIKKFLNDAISMATMNEEIAALCMYTLPRGDKPIEGPSVRLAEIMASAYGNMQVVARSLGTDDNFVIGQGMAWDIEKNLRVTVEAKRRITDRRGRKFNDDMIGVTSNAAASIGLRNAIFRVIPRTYVDHVYRLARAVAVGDASTLSARRQTVMDRLTKMGAMQDRILAKIGRPSVEDVTLDDVATLIGLGTAIKNGDATVDETFPANSNIPEKGKVNLDDVRPAKEENRGHGNEGLQNVAAPAPALTPAAEKPVVTDKAPVVEVRPGVYEEKRPIDPESVCTEVQFAEIETVAVQLDVAPAKYMSFAKTLGYKKFSSLQQKDFERMLAFLRNGGKE